MKIRVDDYFHGKDLNSALHVIKILNDSGDFAKAEEFMDDENYLGSTYSIVMSIILDFSKVGPQFYKYMEKNLSQEWEDYVNEIAERNKKYAEAERTGYQPGEN